MSDAPSGADQAPATQEQPPETSTPDTGASGTQDGEAAQPGLEPSARAAEVADASRPIVTRNRLILAKLQGIRARVTGRERGDVHAVADALADLTALLIDTLDIELP